MGDETLARSIALADEDWSWATWRKPKKPARLPAGKPFDLEQCLERLGSKVKAARFGYEWDFTRAELSPSMSKEEARFWFECMHSMERDKPPKKRVEELHKKKLGALSLEGAVKVVKKWGRDPAPEMALVLCAMFGPTGATDMLLSDKPGSNGYGAGGDFFHGWRKHVLPRLDESEREALRARVRPRVKPTHFPSDFYEEPSGEFFVAASLGMHDEMLTLVSSFSDDRYEEEDWHDAYHVPQVMVFGLGSGELVSQHMRRLGLTLREPPYMRAWLAHTEYGALDWAAKTVAETKNRELAESLAEVLALVHAPENAGPMLEVATRSKAAKVGTAWLDANVGCAAAGLVEVAAGRGALADAAAERLRVLKRAGYAHLIETAAKGAAGDAAKKASSLLAAKDKVLASLDKPPKWLADALSKAAKLKAVAWIDARHLPPLEIEGKTLSAAQVTALLSALAASTFDKPHPLVSVLRDKATPESRDPFAWRLFEGWLTEGAPSKEKWALAAMGHFGGDECALKLAPLVRAWPGESQHQRAVLGLDVLRGIGTDVALLQLSGIAQKVKFQALKRRAGECMEAIAKARKMSRDELEDRIVPDGGFDDKGERVLDFGARKFHVVLGSEGAPMVRDEAGARKADLPKPGAKDDAALAAKAQADWKLLKKTLRETTKIQVVRLEQAMVKGRTWTAKDFETLIMHHPLMGNLARGIVFGVKRKGKLVATFRVADDGSYANEKDVKYTLAKDALVTIVHPLDLSEAQKGSWVQIFGDYELLPPFAQLGRATFALTDKEKKASDLAARFKGQEWGVSAFVGKLARRGWIHGQPQDGGFVGDHAKPFFSTNTTAIVEHTGYPIGSREWADPQKIEKLYFISGTAIPVPWRNAKKHLKLASVDKKAVSEVLLDLT